MSFLFSKSHGNYGTSIKDPEIASHCRHKTQHDIISSVTSSVLSMLPCSETHAPNSPLTSAQALEICWLNHVQGAQTAACCHKYSNESCLTEEDFEASTLAYKHFAY